MKILVADDSTVCRAMLGVTLKTLGHEVVPARDGEEAWDRLRQEHFPLVISDWLMPGVDGLELCRLVRRRDTGKYQYFILLTSQDDRASYLQAMESGVDDFLGKPMDEEQLRARIGVAERILGLQSEVKVLTGLLPICMYCKKIRDDADYWQQLESYISQRSHAEFRHAVCPPCYDEHLLPFLQQFGGDRAVSSP
jgi:phosphoserine phosphatase RsbU/P